MRVGRLVYWFVTGACFGLALDLWALGILYLVGVILVSVGLAALLALVTDTNFQGGLPAAPLVHGGARAACQTPS